MGVGKENIGLDKKIKKGKLRFEILISDRGG
jgi:hypothetical protein